MNYELFFIYNQSSGLNINKKKKNNLPLDKTNLYKYLNQIPPLSGLLFIHIFYVY